MLRCLIFHNYPDLRECNRLKDACFAHRRLKNLTLHTPSSEEGVGDLVDDQVPIGLSVKRIFDYFELARSAMHDYRMGNSAKFLDMVVWVQPDVAPLFTRLEDDIVR